MDNQLTAEEIFGEEFLNKFINLVNSQPTVSHQEYMKLLEPEMEAINKRTGQENDLRYMAYLLEYIAIMGRK